jgi:hypothetical protein
MAKAKTKYGVFEGEAFYTRVFEQNIDDSEYHEDTQGQYNMMFVPKDQAELDKMLSLGFPESSMGHPMVKPIQAADNRLGMKLKRNNVDKTGIEDFGGAPVVTKGKTNDEWSFTEDGAVGNGSKVLVKLSIYGEGARASVRLERVGVLELVPWEEGVGGGSAKDSW